MNNEPVAWMSNDSFEISTMQSDKFSIPLYTSPRTHDLGIADAIGFERGYKAAAVKKLTDEEIKQAKLESWQQCKDTTEVIDFELSYQDELFARAILRKASEK